MCGNFLRRLLCAAIAISFGILLAAASAPAEAALTADSPEVRQAVERGIAYLAANCTSDTRLGACALAGIALLTRGESPDHPTIVRCAEAIQKELGNRDPGKLDETKFDVYSAGLSIIFLVERSPAKHRADVECLLAYLRKIQKPHGGWGYANLRTGDTSMTQYGVLALWKAKNTGFDVPLDPIERAADWLMRTQDPSGAFGYQGQLGTAEHLVAQTGVRPSLTAAGLGSLYACSDLLGVVKKPERRDEPKLPGIKEIEPDAGKPGAAKPKSKVDARALFATAARGNQWFAKNFKVDAGQYNLYYLYAFERYMSLREYCEKTPDKDPQWYGDVAAYLLDKQHKDGSWSGECGVVPDTAFAMLVLMRSMKKSLPYGDGLMIGGRKLPKKLKGATVDEHGQIVPPQPKDLQSLLDDLEKHPDSYDDDSLAPLYKIPDEKAEPLLKKNAALLRRLVSAKSPQVRLAIVKGLLGKTRDLDNVEVLIYAMTDPVPEVVQSAHAALLRIRRNPNAVALPEKFTEAERRAAIEKWKQWYRSIRPEAKFD